LLSNRSVSKRGFVQNEVQKALSVLSSVPPDKVFLIPARLEECAPQHAELKSLKWIDMFPDWKSAVMSIARTMRLGGESTSLYPAEPDRELRGRSSKARRNLALPVSSIESIEKIRMDIDAVQRAIEVYVKIARQQADGREITLTGDGKIVV